MDKQSAIVPNVEGFLLYLSGALTQYDQRASKRRGYSPYALGHYMKALGEIRTSVAKHKKSQEPEALEALKTAIERHFIVTSMPPAKKTIKAIDEFLASGKAPKYPVSGKRTATDRVVDRFIEAHDPYLTVEEIADLCLKCAYTLMADGREGARHSELRQMLAGEGDKWEKMPKGWTDESRKKFWGTLTGGVKHKVTKCIKQMGGKVDDPGAFCAALADRVEGSKWRSESREAAKLAAERYELVYSTGGTGGPYNGLDEAKKGAERMLKGNRNEDWVAVIPAAQTTNLANAEPVGYHHRQRGWVDSKSMTMKQIFRGHF